MTCQLGTGPRELFELAAANAAARIANTQKLWPLWARFWRISVNGPGGMRCNSTTNRDNGAGANQAVNQPEKDKQQYSAPQHKLHQLP